MTASSSETTRLPRIAILGAGSMGGAILAGLRRSAAADDGVVVTTRSAESAARMSADGIEVLSLETAPDANRRAVAGAGLVLLAVKPAMIADLLREIADALEPDAIVVSVAAGVTTASMEALVANPVVRSMPNTPSLVGLGVTGLSAGSRVDDAQVSLVAALFATVGEVIVVPEAQLDALSAVSGSGPAYVFLLIERWTQAAIDLGFAPEQARLMVEQTVRGASELLAGADVDATELRRRVTSPKGTTERAVAVLEEAELRDLFTRAADAAVARAKEIAAGS
ncbi:pyrroline-5-carboxylate reductase [uncultured Schumannella sp.]|uniref:pyrroline-5-carboxylate reductase n=1 Tax=uncultured Schumannella sp. TaxID=1195956 RepID=UPI0025E9567A|nr:pyrroline-5-carboxylate reductase [uncultured Schumannella sp.]